MSTKYKATDINYAYFLTLTTVGWIDIFTRINQKMVIMNALKYCQTNKGLEIYAYVLMHSHIHILCKSTSNISISEIMRDFKKFTSKRIIETILNEPESRREWMLKHFHESCLHLKQRQHYKVWQDGYHAVSVYSNKFIKEKINYIHQNPVKDKIVINAEDYYFSSSRNYAGLENSLDIEVLFMG